MMAQRNTEHRGEANRWKIDVQSEKVVYRLTGNCRDKIDSKGVENHLLQEEDNRRCRNTETRWLFLLWPETSDDRIEAEE